MKSVQCMHICRLHRWAQALGPENPRCTGSIHQAISRVPIRCTHAASTERLNHEYSYKACHTLSPWTRDVSPIWCHRGQSALPPTPQGCKQPDSVQLRFLVCVVGCATQVPSRAVNTSAVASARLHEGAGVSYHVAPRILLHICNERFMSGFAAVSLQLVSRAPGLYCSPNLCGWQVWQELLLFEVSLKFRTDGVAQGPRLASVRGEPEGASAIVWSALRRSSRAKGRT